MNLLGIIIGIGCVITGMMIEGTSPMILVNFPAFIVSCGAAFSACLVQFPFSVIGSAWKKILWLLSPPNLNLDSQAEFLLSLANTARAQGMLALEGSISSAPDDFTRDGVQMIVDGVDKEVIKELLDNAITLEEEKNTQASKYFEAMGGYAPTMGIIGAVLGLIHAMSLLDRPDLLGPSIATAFVATIFGLVFANLICIPASGRIKTAVESITLYKVMTMEGLVSIASGENSLMLKRRLAIYTGKTEQQ